MQFRSMVEQSATIPQNEAGCWGPNTRSRELRRGMDMGRVGYPNSRPDLIAIKAESCSDVAAHLSKLPQVLAGLQAVHIGSVSIARSVLWVYEAALHPGRRDVAVNAVYHRNVQRASFVVGDGDFLSRFMVFENEIVYI